MAADQTMCLTLQFRLKDKHATELGRQARAVNVVWNFCNETQRAAVRWRRLWPSAFLLQRLTAGAGKELGLHSHTVQRVCQYFAKARDKYRKASLRWRGKRSLGWVPFNTGHVTFDGECFVFRGCRYSAWVSRPVAAGTEFGAGSFHQDARGRWFINVTVRVPCAEIAATGPAIGVDLGLKDLLAISTGEKVAAPRWYRSQQARLAIAQRARKKRRVRAINARIAAQRQDFLHKVSTRLISESRAVFVGNVNSSALVRTSMAKSVLDAGWTKFRTQLAYKAIRHGSVFQVVGESFSTQTCSRCGAIPDSSPKGRAGLGIRGWVCGGCGAVHDRDVNAARVILARGLAGLAEGAPIEGSGQVLQYYNQIEECV